MDYADLGPAMQAATGRDAHDKAVRLEATVKALCRQIEKLEARVEKLEKRLDK